MRTGSLIYDEGMERIDIRFGLEENYEGRVWRDYRHQQHCVTVDGCGDRPVPD